MNKGLFQSQAESHFGALIHGRVRKNPPIRRAWYFGALVLFPRDIAVVDDARSVDALAADMPGLAHGDAERFGEQGLVDR
jgi:hypothetical protein